MILKVISIRLPDWMLDLIDKLCARGVFISRSEFIRYAIRLALKRYEIELYKFGALEPRLHKTIYNLMELDEEEE
mgnify:CR=1 FL=1